MNKKPKYSPWKLLANQSQALAFLAVEVLAAVHIGFSNTLAWLLMVIAAWNAFLIVAGTFGAALVAAKAFNEDEAAAATPQLPAKDTK